MSSYYSDFKAEADWCRELAAIEEAVGNFDSAYLNLKCAHDLEDSLLNLTLVQAAAPAPDWL